MIVYVFRHGDAETKSQSPEKTDESRRLTNEGRGQVKRVCGEAMKLGAKPTVIISSPLVRAKQTAEIAKQILNPKSNLKIDSSLEPEGKTEDLYKSLGELNKKDEVMLVTHLPFLGHFIGDFTNWKDVWTNLEMYNGAMMKIDSPKVFPKRGSGTLFWLLPQM
jgi:phosphohistidine phosphatase